MHRFLLPNNDGARLVEGAEAMLSAEESHHLAKVVRIRDGDLIELVNGQGVVAKARVVDASPKRSRVEILSVKALPGQSRVHVCFSVPKAAAFDFIIHRCTELGVASFQPIITNYSLRLHSWNETRWQKVISEVCKQCEEPYFPRLHPPMSIEDWLGKRSRERTLVFCHENERETDEKFPGSPAGFDLLIGSEGGWAADESERLLAYGIIPMGLGKNRLRAEMAAVVGVTLLKQRLGEL